MSEWSRGNASGARRWWRSLVSILWVGIAGGVFTGCPPAGIGDGCGCHRGLSFRKWRLGKSLLWRCHPKASLQRIIAPKRWIPGLWTLRVRRRSEKRPPKSNSHFSLKWNSKPGITVMWNYRFSSCCSIWKFLRAQRNRAWARRVWNSAVNPTRSARESPVHWHARSRWMMWTPGRKFWSGHWSWCSSGLSRESRAVTLTTLKRRQTQTFERFPLETN